MSAHSDTAFLRMFLLVLGALVAFTVIIVIAANMIGGEVAELQADDPMRRAAIAERIKPIGQVNVGGGAADEKGEEVAGPRSGAEVYAAVCMACHATGVAEAPKLGDKAAWTPRVGQGLDKLVEVVITGKGAMPPRGGNPSVSDEEIREAIVHMLAETGVEAPEGASGQAAGDAPATPEQPAEMAAAAVEAVSDAATEGGEQAAEMAESASDMAGEAVAMVREAVDDGGEAEVDLAEGQQIYQKACFACHAAGVAGAPKLGDSADWGPRIEQGSETLLQHAINGYQGQKGYMPPKGGYTSLSDAEVAAAIAYMVNESQ